MLKPITADSLINTLQQIDEKLGKRSYLKSQEIMIQQDILQRATSSSQIDKTLIQYMDHLFQSESSTKFIIFMADINNTLEAYITDIKKYAEDTFNMYEKVKYHIIIVEEKKELLMIIKQPDEELRLEGIVEKQIIQPLKIVYEKEITWAVERIVNLENLPYAIKNLRELLMWSIVLGQDKIITSTHTSRLLVKTLQYPLKLENKMKKALCGQEASEMEKCVQAFILYLQNDLYHPQQIINVYERYLISILNMIKEINSKLDKEIEMKQPLQKLKTIKSMSGLNKLLEGIMQSVIDDYKKSDITDYIVMKATNYIKEHYKESIGLEEISQMLGITPVYLSSQFNKIVGINFTQFVKELRMNEAKKLLMTTDMKLYVIGEKVGYQDPKYFCRVFKEICGISPKIYKEMNAKR
ncbi:MAG: hypothetical protein K0S30_1486 [Clostridia bacterium]|nr:hypothetical protein [Clostridia bacterium]